MNIEDFKFQVEESPVLYKPNGEPYLAEDYKAVVDCRDGKCISVVKKDYNVLPNSVLIEQLMHGLEDTGFKWYIDDSHSFVKPNRMKLQITFPELHWNDPSSNNNLSLFMHNSYDYSEGVRIYWGAIRSICSNGVIFGEVLKSFYAKHTSGFKIEDLRLEMEDAYKKIPQVKHRYETLQRINATSVFKDVEEIEEVFGKKCVKEQEITKDKLEKMKAYTLLCMLSYYISHNVSIQNRTTYQKQIARAFEL